MKNDYNRHTQKITFFLANTYLRRYMYQAESDLMFNRNYYIFPMYTFAPV